MDGRRVDAVPRDLSHRDQKEKPSTINYQPSTVAFEYDYDDEHDDEYDNEHEYE